MRLLLTMPTGSKVGYDEYFSSSPLGIETLAAHARQYADVELQDLRGKGRDVAAHAQMLLARSPDMIGISINSAPHTKYSLALAQEIKRQRADVTLIAGGQQATFITEEMLVPGAFDAVVRGEGEYTICEIIQNKDYRGVAGVSWREAGGIMHAPDRPLIENIDTVLPAARELLPDRSRYRMGEYRVEGIETSRGCAFKCSFCSIRNFHRGKWRPRSVARVMQEIDSILERYSEPKVIYFADDNFATDMRRVEAICREIVARKTDAYFWCQARVDQLSRYPEVVEWMGKAHFAAVLVGIETPIPRLLERARKGTKPEQIDQAIKLLHQHDVGVWGTFTLGLPGETPQESKVSADFIPKAKVDVVQITVATPIPGSELYEQARAAKEILTGDWDQYDFTSPILKDQLPKEQMDAMIQKAYLRSYLSWRFLRSVFSKRTNLSRLRRTAFGAFWAWIKLAAKQRFAALFSRRS